MSDEEKKNSKKKKKSGGGVLFILLIAVLAAILLFIWKFGIGGGSGTGISSGDGSAETALSDTAEDGASSVSDGETQSGAENAEDGIINIVISDSAVLVNGSDVGGSEGLREYILSVDTPDTEYVLIDDRAVKSAYDGAQAVLGELGCSYSQAAADRAEHTSAESTDGEN